MRRFVRLWSILALAAGMGVSGCSDHEFHPPSQEERTTRADSLYTPALFDSIIWSSDSARVQTGNLIYADECRRCHGPLGRGETEYARENELTVPSLVEPDWVHAGSVDTLRRQIFVGHPGGMPNWGVGRLAPRQIDAAAAYILEQLRPEVMGDTTRVPSLLDGADPRS
ncbi:MAG: c-type cytochrome [Longimicrobiales bacterium]